jgi:23S rRNA (cytosine1962-C5)-methyltransferase
VARTELGLDHELLDVGYGRRLDRFGTVIVDRPCPPVDRIPSRDPAAWRLAAARFERAVRGSVAHATWTTNDGRPIEPWLVHERDLAFELRLTPSGQVGLFPEQSADRAWLQNHVRSIAAAGETPRVLLLFAYTGGSTLAALAGGAAVTHVDAARPAVAWARHNVALNDFAQRPVRWIADDAVAFATREARRARRYSGIVLDPPSYGHGSHGRDWRLERDLPELLEASARLLEPGAGGFVQLTSHTPGILGEDLAGWLEQAMSDGGGASDYRPLELQASSGARLALGWSARWVR